jgi:hypothetical protein
MWAKIKVCKPVLDVAKQNARTKPEKPNLVHSDSAACNAAASTLPNRNNMAILMICASRPYNSMWMA